MISEIETWRKNYIKYIEFQCKCLIHAFENGGMKFSKCRFPTFKEFEANIGDPSYDYTRPFFTIDFQDEKRINYHNNCSTPFTSKKGLMRKEYCYFGGVWWNERIIT